MAKKAKSSRNGRLVRAANADIRHMELRDLPEVFELGQKLFTAEQLPTLYRSWDEDEVVDLYASDGDTCLVAEVEGRIVGFALGAMMEKPKSAWRYGWLEWLGVAPRYKRFGIGSRMLAKLTELFIQRDARIMLVDTDAKNRDAIAFFRKHDFGQEIRHVYLSLNLENHPHYIERKDAAAEFE